MIGAAAATALVAAGLLAAAPAEPMWKGSRYTAAQRDRAVQRGLDFIYGTAADPKTFSDYGSDYLWCFFTIHRSAADVRLRERAGKYGVALARRWLRAHPSVPSGASADDVSEMTMSIEAAEKLGVHSPALRAALEKAVRRHSAEQFLDFDPRHAPPPEKAIVLTGTEACTARGVKPPKHATPSALAKACPTVKRTLLDYDIFYDAMITTYFGDRFGVPHGATFADMMKWRGRVRADYRQTEAALGEDAYYDLVYLVTHLVYTHNDYGTGTLDTVDTAPELDFLRRNFAQILADDDAETFAEFVDTFRAFGLRPEQEPQMGHALDLIMSKQNPDGSWGDPTDGDIYNRYHSTWTAVDALREYRAPPTARPSASRPSAGPR